MKSINVRKVIPVEQGLRPLHCCGYNLRNSSFVSVRKVIPVEQGLRHHIISAPISCFCLNVRKVIPVEQGLRQLFNYLIVYDTR